MGHHFKSSFILAPAIAILEAKKADLTSGYGQCVAEMVAAQRFNLANNKAIAAIYGVITSGTQWRFRALALCLRQSCIIWIDARERVKRSSEKEAIRWIEQLYYK